MRQLVAGNWKMNGLAADADRLAAALLETDTRAELMVCPPFPVLARVAALLTGSRVAVGAQDCAPAPCGAYTGDVSAEMLSDAGARAVIVGHSERRQYHAETDALVRAKATAARRAGLLPIICIGETEAERDAGREFDICARQIAGSVPEDFAGAIAYEPIWAIGTGRTPTERDIEAVHRHIRDGLVERLGEAGRTIRILYGGSVKPENAAAILAVPEVGGALVGGASLDPASFLAIATAAAA